MKRYGLIKRVTEEKMQLYIPEDAFYINCFECDFDIDHRISVIFSPDKKRVLGVIEYDNWGDSLK